MPYRESDYRTTVYEKFSGLTLVYNTLYVPPPIFYRCDDDMEVTAGQLWLIARFMKPGDKLRCDNGLYVIEIERVSHGGG